MSMQTPQLPDQLPQPKSPREKMVVGGGKEEALHSGLWCEDWPPSLVDTSIQAERENVALCSLQCVPLAPPASGDHHSC